MSYSLACLVISFSFRIQFTGLKVELRNHFMGNFLKSRESHGYFFRMIRLCHWLLLQVGEEVKKNSQSLDPPLSQKSVAIFQFSFLKPWADFRTLGLLTSRVSKRQIVIRGSETRFIRDPSWGYPDSFNSPRAALVNQSRKKAAGQLGLFDYRDFWLVISATLPLELTEIDGLLATRSRNENWWIQWALRIKKCISPTRPRIKEKVFYGNWRHI